jgi:hypothetical protein
VGHAEEDVVEDVVGVCSRELTVELTSRLTRQEEEEEEGHELTIKGYREGQIRDVPKEEKDEAGPEHSKRWRRRRGLHRWVEVVDPDEGKEERIGDAQTG